MNGLILAGGNSSRMGEDKADIIYHEHPQYIDLHRLLSIYCNEVYISTKTKVYDSYRLIYDDKKYGDIGPMAGLLSAFDFEETDWLVIAVDYPLIYDIEIEQLIESKDNFASVFFHPSTELFEPFLGIYRSGFKKILNENFNKKNYSLQNILHENDVKKLVPKNINSLKNINTKAEYNLHISVSKNIQIKEIKISKFRNESIEEKIDFLAVEEPLEINLIYKNLERKISITMRTPGYDTELALGFLFTENILNSYYQIESVELKHENQIYITIKQGIELNLEKLNRNFYTTSSCGVCGKSSLDSIRTIVPQAENSTVDTIELNSKIIISLKEKINIHQSNFSQTGGIHAASLFDLNGNLISIYEDVGRHNALDKLIGNSFIRGEINLGKNILLLSGRASFELIQKAAMSNIKIVCAIGAPSSLAVDIANEFNMILIGFLKDNSFNIYTKTHFVLD
jgi:FdhD protein